MVRSQLVTLGDQSILPRFVVIFHGCFRATHLEPRVSIIRVNQKPAREDSDPIMLAKRFTQYSVRRGLY